MNRPDNNTRFIALFFAAFVCYAFFTILFGSQAPLMMQYYAIGAPEQGFLTTMLSVGGIACAVVCALFGERFPKLRTLGIGLAVLAAVTLLIGFAPPYMAVVFCALLAGIAYTLVDIMVNSSITQYLAARAKKVLPMTHMVFSAGAMAGPYFMTAIVNPAAASSFALPFLLVGGITGVVCILFGVFSLRAPASFQAKLPPPAESRPTEVFRAGRFWMLLLSGVLFCCCTTGIVTWYTTFFNQTRGYSLDISGLMLTLFFAGSLIMRFFSPFIFSRIKPQKIFVSFSCLSVLCLALAFTFDSFPLAVLFTILGGALQALNMPALIFVGTALFPNRHAAATSVAIFSYNIGGIIAPYFLGVLAGQMGFQIPMYLSCGLFALGILVMAALSVKYRHELQNA